MILHSLEWIGILLARVFVGLLFFFPDAANSLSLNGGSEEFEPTTLTEVESN
jgi:hypothetical protein